MIAKNTTSLYSLGARRFGSGRWADMATRIGATLQKHGITTNYFEVLTDLTWDACLQAWGAETAHGADKHCTRKVAGVIIWHGDRMAMQERLTGACGIAPSAGHLEESEDAESAMVREAYEELGIIVNSVQLLGQGRRFERCKRYGSDYHDWSVFQARIQGDALQLNPGESKHVAWYQPYQVLELAQRTEQYLEQQISEADWRQRPGLEVVWYHWMRDLGILDRLAQLCAGSSSTVAQL